MAEATTRLARDLTQTRARALEAAFVSTQRYPGPVGEALAEYCQYYAANVNVWGQKATSESVITEILGRANAKE